MNNIINALTNKRDEAERSLRHLEGQLNGVQMAVEKSRASMEMANEMLNAAIETALNNK